MTEPIESAPVTERSGYGERPSRLVQVAAGVGIVAGVVFVIAVVFLSGFFLGESSTGYGGDGRPAGQMGPGGKPGTCPMTGGGMMQPGGMVPGGMMPGGTMGPSPSSTTTPSTPRP